ncbi:hypothetical protein [Paenibacillus sabuli]|nr:hypothetical protein [Paenibacillus sabuli]
MVEKKEKLILDLALREKLSDLEYKELEKTLTQAFGSHSRDILSIFIIHNMDEQAGSDRAVQTTLYPTVFHQGITITRAVVEKRDFENAFFNETRLIITEEYVGDDEKLKDWTRDYIFTPNQNGDWELSGFSGVMNFMGEDFNMDYLALKDDELPLP